MEILTSQAVLTIFGILAVYFGVKLVAVAFRLWTPRHRSLTLDEAVAGVQDELALYFAERQ